ncbi:MAG: hypothetical protein IJC21_01645 [Lentisphaeria bacterium]|nr:hypothetical protein [Lentisphaeria bacterium]
MKKILLFFLIVAAAVGMAQERFGVPAKYTLLRGNDDSRALETAKGYLFSAGKRDLTVYDISNPLEPVKKAVLKGVGPGRQMAHSGDYLYLTKRASGITIIDIKNPLKPEVAGVYDTVEMATGIDIAGNLLFCAQRIYGIETLDITDPVNPRPVSLQRTPEAQSCIYKDSLLYVGDWGASCLTVIDMKNPAEPRIIAQKPLDGYGDGVDVVGNCCYAATGHHSRSKDKKSGFGGGHGLEIFSLADPRSPEKLSVLKFPRFHVTGNDFWTVRVSGNTAAVADTHNGVFIVDVTDKKNPVIKSRAVFPEVKFGKRKVPACVADIELGKDVVYAAVQGVGLAVIPVDGVTFSAPRPQKKITVPRVAEKEFEHYRRFDFKHTVRRVAIKDDTAYVACSAGGLQVLDLVSGKIRQSIPTARTFDVAVSGDKLYCAAGFDGVIVYKIKSDNTLEKLYSQNTFSLAGTRRIFTPDVQMLMKPTTGNMLAFSDRTSWIYFADTAKQLALTAREHFTRLLYGDALPDDDINGVLPVHYCNYGTLWFDVSGDTAKLAAKTTLQKNVSGQSEGWTVLNGKFLAPSRRGYTLLDPAKYGADCVFTPHKSTYGTATANGNIVAFTGRVKGTVRVFDFSNPANPVELKKYALNLSGTPDRARFWKGHLVVPAGLDGLLVTKEPVK